MPRPIFDAQSGEHGFAKVDGVVDSTKTFSGRLPNRVISITELLTKTAMVPQGLVGLRNMVVGALNPFIRKRLARRLSLLDYFEQVRSEQIGKKNREVTNDSVRAA